MKQRQWLLSVGVFVLILAALVSIDPRVHDQFNNLISSGNGIASWQTRALDFGGAIVSAIRHQSIDNSPLLIFATVGAVLFVFMVRT
jgi:hypothetical protein